MKRDPFVIGHKNPDTDAISAALAVAELKGMLGEKVIPGRLGTLNEETKFATRFFDIEAPMLLEDGRCRLSDIELDAPVEIKKDASCNEAYERVTESPNRTLFITENDRMIGLVSISDLNSIKIASREDCEIMLSKSNVKLISGDVHGRIVYEAPFNSNGRVMVLTEKTSDLDYKGAIVLCEDEMKLEALKAEGASLIIYTGKKLSRKVSTTFRNENKKTSLIATDMDTTSIIRRIYEAIPVSLIMAENIYSYKSTDFLEDVKDSIINTRFRSYPVVDEEGKLIGSVSRYHLFNYEKKRFILVDHSSRIQSIDHLDKAEIIEVIDHHNIGDIQTSLPIYYRNVICGSSCSIVYDMYKENGLVPSKGIAGMMLSAIISDTLYFQSKTCRPTDIVKAQELAKIAGVELDDYANQLLNASVNLKDASFIDILERDLKQYVIGKNKIAIGQTNYNDITVIQTRMDEFKKLAREYRKEKGFDLLVMMFTHVRGDGTMFLFMGPKRNIMFNIIETKISEHVGYDTKIMSRKQQLVPAISEQLEKM